MKSCTDVFDGSPKVGNNMNMRSVCLVTDEVMPFTRGGIGAFVRNMIRSYSDDYQLSVLFTGHNAPDPAAWITQYPNVKLITAPSDEAQSDLSACWEARDMRHAFMAKSLRTCKVLIGLSDQGIDFDIIEFIDWGGQAFYAIQAKRCGLWKCSAFISVRIHCTESVLRHFEYRIADQAHNYIYDIERKSLADADLVVSSLEPIANFYNAFYGFNLTWRSRIIVEPPSVWVSARTKNSITPNLKTPIVFSSKLQEIKNPNLFLYGTAIFMEEFDAYSGDAILAAFKTDQTAMKLEEMALPDRLRKRFITESSFSELEREILIANSIVVFPNSFEAFCFAAYEASFAGAVVVLNGRNPAFGDGTPWIDGLNCLKFDGTANGLSSTFHKIFSDNGLVLKPVELPVSGNPYWGNTSLPRDLQERNSSRSYKDDIELFILHQDEATGLEETLASIMAEEVALKITVIDNNSQSVDAKLSLAQIERRYAEKVSIKRSAASFRWGTLLNKNCTPVNSKFTCIVPAGTILTIGLLGALQEALSTQPEFGVILPDSAVISLDQAHSPSYVFHSLGESYSSGVYENTFAAHMFFCRSELLQRHRFSENLERNFEWEFLRRLAVEGVRMLVWPLVDVSYRDHAVSSFNTHSTGDAMRNVDLINKSSIVSRRFGSVADIPKYLHSDGLNLVDIENERHQVMSLADPNELEIRRTAAKQKSAKIRKRSRLSSIMQLSRLKFHFSLDSIMPARIEGDTFFVVAGAQVAIKGWAFGAVGDSYLLPNMVLVRANAVVLPSLFERHRRLDVSLKFGFDESLPAGFLAMFDTQSFDHGVYEIYVLHDSGTQQRKRKLIGKLMIG